MKYLLIVTFGPMIAAAIAYLVAVKLDRRKKPRE